jgi:hypothetical protein
MIIAHANSWYFQERSRALLSERECNNEKIMYHPTIYKALPLQPPITFEPKPFDSHHAFSHFCPVQRGKEDSWIAVFSPSLA